MKKRTMLLFSLIFSITVGIVYSEDNVIEEGPINLGIYPKKCVAGKMHMDYQQRRIDNPNQPASIVMLSKLKPYQRNFQWNGGNIYTLPGWVIKRDLLDDYKIMFVYNSRVQRFMLKIETELMNENVYLLKENSPILLQNGIFLVLAKDPKVPTNETRATPNNFERSYFLFISDCNQGAIEYLHAMNDTTGNV